MRYRLVAALLTLVVVPLLLLAFSKAKAAGEKKHCTVCSCCDLYCPPREER